MAGHSGLRSILEGWHPRYGKAYALLSTTITLVAVTAYTIGTIPDLPPWAVLTLQLVEVAVIALFAGDYFLRLAAAEKPLRYVFSFWGLVDLVAFLPALVMAGTELTSARALRLIQLARVLKLGRLAHAFDQLYAALRSIRDQLVAVLLLALIMLFLASVGIYHFEHAAQPEKFASIPHAMWWAIATLTTVGYGDIYPITTGGRIFTALVLIIGLAVIAVPTALISAALISQLDTTRKGKTKGDHDERL